jgi:hypothetical protein
MSPAKDTTYTNGYFKAKKPKLQIHGLEIRNRDITQPDINKVME